MTSRWTLVLLVSVGLLLVAVGCVPKQKYDEAVAASRRANEQLRKVQAELQTVRSDNQKLRDQLASCNAAVANKDKLITQIDQANKDLTEKLHKLKELYDKLAARQSAVGSTTINILPVKVDVALRSLAKENPDLMEYLPKYGMIKLKADLTFDKGSAKVKPEAVEALKKLAKIVNSDAAKRFGVYVAGHTDDIPLVKPETIRAHGSNWGLSLHRAGAVVKVLAMAGVSQRRLCAMGFSKYHPIAPNKPGHKGNPLNRRVEIWIVPPDRFLTVSNVVQPEK